MQIINNTMKLKKCSRAVMFATMSSCLLLSGCDLNDDDDANANSAPSIPMIDNTDGRELVPFNAMISATDADEDKLLYTKLSGPDWLVVGLDGTVTGTPPLESLGSSDLTFRVFDGSEYVEGSAVINIVIHNRAPDNFEVSNLTGITSQPFEAVVSAQDLDQDPLTFALVDGPEVEGEPLLSLEGDKLTGVIPAAGSYAFTLSVTDGEHVIEQSFNLLVSDPNQGPTDLTVSKLTAIQTVEYAATLSATDIEGDALTYELVSGPGWLSLDGDQLTGVTDVPGDYSFEVSVSDGEFTITEEFTLVVDKLFFGFTEDTIVKNGGVIDAEFSEHNHSLGDYIASFFDNYSFEKLTGPDWLTIDAEGGLAGVFAYDENNPNTFSIKVTNNDDGEEDIAVLNITHAQFAEDILPAAIGGIVGSSMPLRATDGHDNSSLTFELVSDDLGGKGDLFDVTPDGYIVLLRQPTEEEIATVSSGNLAGDAFYTLNLTVTDGIANDVSEGNEKIRIRKVASTGLNLMETLTAEWANIAESHVNGFALAPIPSKVDHSGDAVEAVNGGETISSTTSLRSKNGADHAAIFDTTGQQNIKLYYDIAAKDLIDGLKYTTNYSIDGINWVEIDSFSNDVDGVAKQVFVKKEHLLPADANDQKTLWIQFNSNGAEDKGTQHGYIDNFLIQGDAIPAQE
ncbi:putative Ig domain-containing protein [Thalassotalea sp. PLHSN55]|uniref:putative Ig domain-containing protein n=1 Tax=Thalassotalea sp. PLHSN55 TaxID=3435888 RepID=UPI003F874683